MMFLRPVRIFLGTRFVLVELNFCRWRQKLKFFCARFSVKIQVGSILRQHRDMIDNLCCATMTFDPLENVHFHSNLASSAGFDVFEMLHKKLETVFARPFLSHRRVCFGAHIRVEMDGCKQMMVIVAHCRICLIHSHCQLEPGPADFHESNENQAKEHFSSSGRSQARPKQNEFTKKCTGLEIIRVGQLFAKDNRSRLIIVDQFHSDMALFSSS
jgi:hypothetical protein